MRICKTIFSTNRLEFLIPTLDSFHKNFDYGDHEVFGIFIDDYPNGRNDGFVEALAKKYGYQKVILHQENKGITGTWGELFEILKDYQFDYVWMQEDDVILEHPVKIDDMIEVFNKEQLTALFLQRQAWYFHEQDTSIEDTDIAFKHHYYVQPHVLTYLSPISTLCRYETTQVPYKQISGFNPAEGVIPDVLKHLGRPPIGSNLKHSDGKNLITHIGEYSHGKRVCEGEPGWENFKVFDPNKKYNSRSGVEITDK